MKVNMKQISEITGFSQATISNALNKKRGVNADTAARILSVARELGYLEEESVQRVKFVTFLKEGLIADAPYFPPIIAAAEKECRSQGMEMVLHNINKRSAVYEEEIEQLREDKSSAVILLGTEMTAEDMDVIRAITTPLVVIDYWNKDEDFDAVLINNTDSVQRATEYLLKMGHRKIGYVRSKFRYVPFQERELGLRRALAEAGLTLPDEMIFDADLSLDSHFEDELAEYIHSLHEFPTAFFVDDDTIALAAMKVILACGLRIPEDISLVGFDDILTAAYMNPALTTVGVPKQEIGRAAAQRLFDIIRNGSDVKYKIHICTSLVERESVLKLN